MEADEEVFYDAIDAELLSPHRRSSSTEHAGPMGADDGGREDLWAPDDPQGVGNARARGPEAAQPAAGC